MIVSPLPDARRRLTPEEINALPAAKWDGPIRLVANQEALAAAHATLSHETLLGFDTESRPSFRKGLIYHPTLVQLAGEHEVFLFQLAKLSDKRLLLELLENPAICKAGVAVHQDARQLQPVLPFTPGGFVDLGDVAGSAAIPHQGLKGLAACLLGFRISKKAQCSNWAADHLEPHQVVYAATDAWISREICLSLQSQGLLRIG